MQNQPDHGFLTAKDNEGRIERIQFSPEVYASPVYREFSQALVPINMFSLGTLLGICISLAVAKGILQTSNPADAISWMVMWLLVIALVWTLGFFVERHRVFEARQNGKFDQMMRDGADPVSVVAGIYFATRSFRVWSSIVMLCGTAVLSLEAIAINPLPSVAISICSIALAGLIWQYAHRRRFFLVQPRRLERQLLSYGEYLLDGGWVVPAGTLLIVASLALMYFWRADVLLLVFIVISGVLLAAWSERASCAEANRRHLAEWRNRLRERLSVPAAPAPVQVIPEER